MENKEIKAPVYDKNSKEKEPFEYYTKVFAEANPAEMSRRSGEPFDEKNGFTIHYLGGSYQIRWPGFRVIPHEDDPVDYLSGSNSAQILVLRHLVQGAKTESSGKFLSFREMPNGELYFRQFQGRCLFRFKGKYGSRPEAFAKICEKMGAKKVAYADQCYDFELFDGLFVRFILWAGDEEFPASTQILFSDNFLQAFETYDLAEIGGIILSAMGFAERTL